MVGLFFIVFYPIIMEVLWELSLGLMPRKILGIV